ncbi:MAG: hypothetical protein M1840_006713 [Geoglossum simile]|nr:MAG: hypothetical protein M1840_006713 [Geoglossum simile]
METENDQKHSAITKDGDFCVEDEPGRVFAAVTSGSGWVLIKNARYPDPECQQAWDNCLADRNVGNEDGFLGTE